MAGNGLIKLLRCTSTTRANSTEILLDGQPLVEQDTHLIYVGDGVTEAKNLTPYGGGGAQLEDNCVFYSKVQNLTDDEKEQARENIGVVGTGENGVGWYPATFNNYSIQAGIVFITDENSKTGDYCVLTVAANINGTPYEAGSVFQIIRKWNATNVSVQYENFSIRGAKGEDADPNSVLYVAQTLTDEQKQQARTNIGAITASEAEVPVASQTQFGTVKVYTDSDGYLCIDTE